MPSRHLYSDGFHPLLTTLNFKSMKPKSQCLSPIRSGEHPPTYPMSKKTLAVLLAGLTLMGCTKTITIDINRSDAKIVIEGNVTNETGPYQVLLSRTLNLSETINYNGVSGAIV